MRLWLGIAAFSGLAAVGLGAYAAHGVPTDGPEAAQAAEWVEVAWRYHMAHSLLLLFLAFWMEGRPRSRPLQVAAGFTVLGLLLFSGSLYLMGLADMLALRPVVPFGGVAFLLGWACLVGEAVKKRR